MGLLDLPAPLYETMDGLLAGVIPPVGRVIVWAFLGAGASMLLYWALSPQSRIADAKAGAQAARRALNEHDGDFDDAGPLIANLFRTSFRHIGLVLPATLAASLPMLTLLVWLDTSYAHDLPGPGSAPAVTVTPANFTGAWRDGGIEIRSPSGDVVQTVELKAPVPRVEKRHWWNALIGNPAGYLPDAGPVEAVSVALPQKSYLPVGPGWARTWLALFLPVLMAASFAIFKVARIA